MTVSNKSRQPYGAVSQSESSKGGENAAASLLAAFVSACESMLSKRPVTIVAMVWVKSLIFFTLLIFFTFVCKSRRLS